MPGNGKPHRGTTRGHTVSKQPHRTINEEIWNFHRQKIELLYVIGGNSLKDVQKHLYDECGFTATYVDHNPPSAREDALTPVRKKQWKERLGAWGCRKNLNPPVAACILFCHRKAEQAHSPVCVKFNGKVKTHEDISRYIAKSTSFKSEEDLLRYLPAPDAWPGTVTSEPPVNFDLHSAATGRSVPDQGVRPGPIPQPVVSLPLAPPTLHARNETVASSSQICHRFDAQGFSAAFDFPAFAFDPFYPLLPPDIMGGGDVPPTHGLWITPQTNTEQYFSPFDSAPTSRNSNSATLVSDPAGTDFFTTMKDYGSVTPIGIDYDRSDAEDENGKQTEIKISAMLGTKQDLRDSPLRFFLMQCCAAAVWYGQNDSRRTDSALQTATTAFARIAMNHYTYSLMILNNMRVLLDSYGHKDIIQHILRKQQDSVIQDSVDVDDQRKPFVIREAIGFMLDTFEWRSDQAQEHVSRVRDICSNAMQTAGETSPLAISASYNLAWVLLEADEDEEALTILRTHKAHCETTYGLYQIQTITWIATLARAHRKVNDQVTAESLMEETVAVRVEKAFSKEHPLYWEIQFRRGLFMMNFANSGCAGGRTEECWDSGETLFRNTLQWRKTNLGSNNPKTGIAWEWLNYCLRLRGKTDDANELETRWQNQQ